MTKYVRRVSGTTTIIGGLILLIIGVIFIPLLGPFGAIDNDIAMSFTGGSGILAILGGTLLLMDKMEGGGVALGGAVMSFTLFLMTGFTDDADALFIPLWFLVGPGITVLGGSIGLMAASDFKVIKKNDIKIEETLHPLEKIFLEKFNVLKIEYYGRYFGGLFFLIEFKNGQDAQKFELLSFLESTLNQKVCLASKMIPESTLLKDNMYYLFRSKHNIPITRVREMNFISEIK